MLARKQMMSSKQSTASVRMEKSRLAQARTLAFRRQDLAEVRSIDAKLAELNATNPEVKTEDKTTDIMAMVNERNRKANLEATRKAEQEAERKKRERKLAAAVRASDSPAPSALAALKIDVSRYVVAPAPLPERPLTYYRLDPSRRALTIQRQRPWLPLSSFLGRLIVSKHPLST